MGFFGSFLMLAFVGWLVFGIGRRVLRCTGRLIPFTLLGIAAVATGLALFGSDDDNGFRHVHVGPLDFSGSLDLDDNVPVRNVRSVQEDPEELGFELRHSHASFPKWVLIALGSVLIISGTLLASRERTRPVAFKALTILGLAAGGFMLFSFFNSPPQNIASRDRVVRAPELAREIQEKAREKANEIRERVSGNSRELAREIREKASEMREKVSGNSRAKKPTKSPTMRAKRPTMRPEKSDPADLAAELPPRAGEIPVGAELAKSEIKTPEPPGAPVPAAAPAVDAPVTAAKPAPEPTPPSTAPAEPSLETPVTEAAPKETPPAPPNAEPAAAPSAVPVTPTEATQVPAATPAVSQSAVPVPAPHVASPPAGIPESKKAEAPPVAQPGPTVAPYLAAMKRPAWVETPGRLEGVVYRTSVKSGLYVDVPECQRALDLAIRKEANHYVDDYLGAGAAGTIDLPLGYLRKHLVKQEFGEVVQSESVGPMQQIHALLEFDDEARADFHSRWRDAVVTNRLWYAGSATALVLLMLGTFYSYLTLDLRTGGAHKGQLRLAATLVAMIVVAGALLVRRAVPF